VWYFDSVRSGWLVTLAVVCAAHAATAEPTPDPSLDPKNLKTLTADPLTGKADRIDGDETAGMVAFTFDDGPNPKTTPDVIDALEKYDVPATFFIVTQRIVGRLGARSRDVLARELADGFMVGSHSVTHPNLGTADAKVLDHEVDGSIRTLAILANRPIGMFRPPYGSMNKTGRLRLKQLGLTEVQWSVDTMDWASHNAERLRKRTVSMIFKQNGGVVLMHDVKPITARTIIEILDDVEAENCKRLAAGTGPGPIIPVSLHYFLKDGKTARAIPADVQKRTEAYKKALPGRCAARPAIAKAPPPATK
jgi:peptidoglycan/xylan/chitin deacetylase (PgdA/CDA1 family)